mmetsp:Transcript_3144/g.9098  ORF Transcript_3144/g.9098 Transcript_3144/m.9098 type:complete len:224 (-) Transcript_3144:422-1093(-)
MALSSTGARAVDAMEEKAGSVTEPTDSTILALVDSWSSTIGVTIPWTFSMKMFLIASIAGLAPLQAAAQATLQFVATILSTMPRAMLLSMPPVGSEMFARMSRRTPRSRTSIRSFASISCGDRSCCMRHQMPWSSLSLSKASSKEVWIIASGSLAGSPYMQALSKMEYHDSCSSAESAWMYQTRRLSSYGVSVMPNFFILSSFWALYPAQEITPFFVLRVWSV